MLALLVLGCGSASADGRHLRVLFIGNSLTSTNDLPSLVAAFAATQGVTVETEAFAPGGFSLEDHWRSGAARAALDAGGWDAVVMQQGPSSLPASGQDLTRWTRRWADEARAHHVRPVLLTVWPDGSFSDFFVPVIEHYRAAAAAAKAALFPAGVAWQAALRRDPRLRLFGPDRFHPSPLGTYLTAAVVHTGLTGELPRALPRSVRGVEIDAATARVLRAAVGEAYARKKTGS